ncbi:MAG: GAF domain-containing protein [Chloroflexi bacterium]|nr:GAF domain-containing protein [Chloroflexota bacterium]
MLSLLVPLLSPLAGERWGLTVAALGFVPPALLLSVMFWRASHEIELDTFTRSQLSKYPSSAIIVDVELRVVWTSPPVVRWLGVRQPGAATRPPLFELLRGVPCAGAIRHMLETGALAHECETVLDGEEHVLRIGIQPLDGVRNLPGARLITLDDVTASRIRRNLAERVEELMALSRISADIASCLDVDEVIHRALRQVIVITEADEVVVYVPDDEQPEHLQLAGNLTNALEPSDAPPALPVENSTLGRVLRTREPVVTPDAAQAPAERERMTGVGFEAAITVPLLARDRTLGVLQAGWSQARSFDPVEIALLESIGQQLAVALDNAHLHSQERQQRQMAEVLREVASILSSKKLDDALLAMLVQLQRVLAYDAATVLLLAESGFLAVRAHYGLQDSPPPEHLKSARIEIAQFPYLMRLFASHEIQTVADTSQDPEWQLGNSPPYGAWIGAPLSIRGHVVGCLSIKRRDPGPVPALDVQIARTFADQAAIAVWNTQLFESEQLRRVQAELLQQTSYDLVTSSDLDSALLAALANLTQMLDFSRAHIGLIDNRVGTWTMRAEHPSRPAHVSPSPIPLTHYPLVGRLVREKTAMMVGDTHQHPDWRPGIDTPHEIRSWIGVPLMIQDRVFGMLNIDGYAPNSFTDEHFQVAQTFGNQIAAAIEMFRLLEEADNQNQTLRALNTVVAASNEALTHQNLLAVALERVLETLNLTGGAIHRRDHDLRLRAVSGLPAAVIERILHLPLQSSLPAITTDDGQHHAFYSVPLVSHGAEIGMLSIREPVAPRLHGILANIGQQLGVVMDNAMLFDHTLRREELSTDLGRLSLAISTQLDRDSVLDLICRESIGVFDAQGAYIWLIEEERLVGRAAHGPGAADFIGHTLDLDSIALLPAQVINEWRPHYVNRVAGSPRLSADLRELTHAQSVIAVPLIKADVPLGTLLLSNIENPDAFADWLVDQIGLLGVQAALALQNATLFEELHRRLEHLRLVNEVGRYAIAILSQQSLLESVARKLFETLRYDVIGMLQMEAGDLVVRSRQVREPSRLHLADPDAYYESLVPGFEQAVQQGRPLLRNRLCADGDRSVECCSLMVPLIVADEVIGVLVVERTGYDTIVQEDLDVLEPLATQLAISVQNARLFEAVRQQAVALEARVAERTAEIRQQHERIVSILRSVADAVIVFDLAGQVILTNPVARQLFDQHDLDLDLGQHIGALVADALAKTDAHDPTEVIEVGPVALQAKAARVVAGENVVGSVVVLRDISRLRELDRMKDLFVSNVSHELRTPLANLKLYLSLLHQGRPERRDDYLAVMGREMDRLERLITDLLDLSRLQDEQQANRPQVRQAIDIGTLIDRVINDNAAWAESKNEHLEHSQHAALPQVWGDPDQIVRALTNLVGNAINYTPHGGQVIVRSQVELSEHTNPEWVIIEVVDTGIGIPKSEQDLIFDRFYRGSNVDPNVPGTGLGLAIIKEIVELHGGAIEVESKEHHGSTFRLRLPALNSSLMVGEQL